ncbi:MlaD family protein [Thiobacter aerophilum]|uniref:MlaD family protein n=1 Tax=Thiobacter aerophilum TaxID=3121275 RepID=A0ABV0EGL6_9BURK
MESRFSYTLVGAFVLLMGAALVGVVFWLYAGGLREPPARVYYAYFDESVAGLNVNAPVKYKGVTVGRVTEIELAPDGSGRVRLVMSLDERAPIRSDTVATLRMQGLTGLMQVELTGGSPDAPPLAARAPDKVPVIPTRPSLMTRLDTAVSTVLANLNRGTENLNALTDEATRRQLRQILANVETSTRLLAQQMPVLEATLKSTSAAGQEVAHLAQRLQQTAGRVERMADEITRVLSHASGATQALQTGMTQLAGQTLPELDALLIEMRELAQSLRRASSELERQPSSLVFGRPVSRPGPGE